MQLRWIVSPDGLHESLLDVHKWPSRKTASSRRESPLSIELPLPFFCAAFGGSVNEVTDSVVFLAELPSPTPGTPVTAQTFSSFSTMLGLDWVPNAETIH